MTWLLLFLTALAAPPPAPVPPLARNLAPPVVQTFPSAHRDIGPIAPSPAPMLRSWSAGTASCEGVTQAATVPTATRPTTWYGPLPEAARVVALTFAIDPAGRPHAITRDRPAPGWIDDDLVPAFAASRFAPGPARTACAIRFFQNGTPVADAPLQDVYAATIPPVPSRVPALFDRIRPAGARCENPRLEPLLIAVPPFRSIPKVPGRPGWTVIRFDVAANGHPTGITAVATSGDAALAQATRKAVSESRFEPIARTGCLWPYAHGAGALPAPEIPPQVKAQPPGATCPDALPWVDPLAMRFPENFRRRSIEGWAAIAYDVASWGQTGNIRVIAAEPAADFGDAAARMILAGRKPPSPSGHTGCTVVVRYKVGERTTTADPAIPPPPPF